MSRGLWLLLLLCAACGEAEQPVTVKAKQQVVEEDPPIEDDGTVPLFHARRLQVTDQLVGQGEPVGQDATEIVVHLHGFLTGGYVFQDTRKKGQPVTYDPNEKLLVVGLIRGIKGMRVGGKRKIIVPPEIGFRGKKVGRIPPFSTLIYEVELLRFK